MYRSQCIVLMVRFVTKLALMKHSCLFFLIFTVFFTNVQAQQNHFIYFQTENKQPFYIKLDGKKLNSSSSGYLIVPKLPEDTYKIIFGSPANEWPEQEIQFALAKDAGFLIKKFGDKGWGLFDLQSLNILMPGEDVVANNNSEQQPKKEVETQRDNFSEMLATVVNDSTIKQKDIVVKEPVNKIDTKEKAPEQTQPVTNVDVNVLQTDTAQQVLYTVITKNLQTKGKDGMEMIYTDEYNNNKDTISVYMPLTSDKNKQPEASKTTSDTNAIIQQQPIPTEPDVQQKIADSANLLGKHETMLEKDTSTIIKQGKEDKIEFLPAKSGMINSNCKQYATEDDFYKLRKKMAAEGNNDDMIKVAKKIFKSKCFTTRDIKNLSALFLNDEGRYNFFDAAYPYVSDSDVFNTLESQISDAYYLNRFKAMLHH